MKKKYILSISVFVLLIFSKLVLPIAAQNDDTNAPTLTAEEISKRMIELIKTIKTKADISPENIERVMKIKVEYGEENRQSYGFGGLIEGNLRWTYNLSAYSYPGNARKAADTVNFSFNPLMDDENSGRDDYAPVCTIDFDAYSKELKDAEFSFAPYYGEHGRLLWWNFSRGAVSVQITAYGENTKRVNHQCVGLLTVNVGSGTTTDVGQTDEVNYPAQIENSLFDDYVKAESALLLTINKSSEIFYKNKEIKDADFTNRMNQYWEEHPKSPDYNTIFIKSDVSVKFGKIIEILRKVKESEVAPYEAELVVRPVGKDKTVSFDRNAGWVLRLRLPDKNPVKKTAPLYSGDAPPALPTPTFRKKTAEEIEAAKKQAAERAKWVEEKAAKKIELEKPIVVSLEAAGNISLNGKIKTNETLLKALREMFKKREYYEMFRSGTNDFNKSVELRIAPQVSYGDAVKLIDAINGAGANRLSLSNLWSDK